jgi:hypothetical protein
LSIFFPGLAFLPQVENLGQRIFDAKAHFLTPSVDFSDADEDPHMTGRHNFHPGHKDGGQDDRNDQEPAVRLGTRKFLPPDDQDYGDKNAAENN